MSAEKEGFFSKFKRKAFSVNTFDSIYDNSGGLMKRTLAGWQLMLLGIGTMVGAGVFVSSGPVAKNTAGPALMLSYVFAGFACILSATCYAEYSCDYPVAGGAFNFVTASFGELMGWLIACNLFIEWTLANAAVAKGFSGYFANMIGVDQSVFKPLTVVVVEESSSGGGFVIEIDWLAPLMILCLTGIMLLGTKESTWVQNITVFIYMGLISFIIIAGATRVDNSNYSPFTGTYGIAGIFNGASSVFWSFVGFDMVASMAEEAKKPSRDMPIGIIGSLSVAIGIYVAMATVLVGMQYYTDLDENAAFAVAFEFHGWDWAAKIVSVGAVIGCTVSNYGGLLGQSRIFVTMARAGLLPLGMAKMSSRTVPYWSIAASGGIAAVLALFLGIGQLMDFVSIGTLVAYGSVCLGVLWRRYYVKGETSKRDSIVIGSLIFLIICCGLMTGFANKYIDHTAAWATPLGLFALFTACFYFLPQRSYPQGGFAVPLLPWIPAAGMMVNGFLIGTLTPYAFYFWICWMAIAVFIYAAYGLHNTQGEGKSKTEEMALERGSLPPVMGKVSLVPGEGPKSDKLGNDQFFKKESNFAKGSIGGDAKTGVTELTRRSQPAPKE